MNAKEQEMEKPTEDQDSWKPWLEDLCSKNGIVFIDPTPDLLKMKQSGKDVYYDHFTRDGHVAFAESFVDWFIANTYQDTSSFKTNQRTSSQE